MTTMRVAMAELSELHGGALTPRLVVDAARDEASPLHSHIFHVPVDEAAERYYLGRARGLIRSFKVGYRTTSGEQHQVRAYTSTLSETGPVYRPTEEVVADEFATQLLMRTLDRELKALKVKYGHLQEFTTLVRQNLLGEVS